MAATEKISEPQVNFIKRLCQERDLDKLTKQQYDWLESAELETLNRGQASRVITALKELPKRAYTPTMLWPSVPAGRYAIDDLDGVTKFYKVDRPEDGRWAGMVFVSVQASDEFYPVKHREARRDILNEIEKDPQAAMLRYGQEIGRCGHCGRTLTNEESRARGIGPICYARMGWV